MELRHTRLIYLGFGWNSLQEAHHFEPFSAKKRGLELAAVQPQSQSFGLFSLGLCKGPVLRKQTNNDFGSAKKYHRYFRLALLRSGHFLIGYPELLEAFGASCGEGGWTHWKCYNLSYLITVLPLNLVHSTIFKNFFRRECLFWKTLYNHPFYWFIYNFPPSTAWMANYRGRRVNVICTKMGK